MNHRGRLPKITPPILREVIRRPRVFSLFDQSSRLLWIAGAPGEGKTTAVADYIGARKYRVAWLNVDEGDRDPANFFHHLGSAIATALPKHRFHFPAIEAEHRRNLNVFSRLFFRYVATRVTKPLIIVLDNLQEASSETLFKIIDAAVEELSSQIRLFVISRESAPSSFARLLANQQLRSVPGDSLRFTRDETLQLLSRNGINNVITSDALHDQTQGWAAGLVFLRETSDELASLAQRPLTDHKTLAEYFASEGFTRANGELQKLFLRTVYLPHISVPVANALCGYQKAASLLNDLCSRNLFTQQVAGTPPLYQYHPLFRDFLRDIAERTLPAEERNVLQRQSAHLLHQTGYVEDAIAVLLEGGFHSEAVELILDSASKLCAQGRHQTLLSWLISLPEELFASNPWLNFWLGEAYLVLDDSSARAYLDLAYNQFREENSNFGQLLTAATALEAVQWGETTYQNIEVWSNVVKRIYDQDSLQCDVSDELRIVTGRLLADVLFGQASSELQRVSERLLTLIGKHTADNRRLAAAIVLLGYYFLVSQRDKAELLITIMQPMLDTPDLSATKKASWFILLGYYSAFRSGDKSQAEKHWRQAEAIADNAQLLRPRLFCLLYRCELAMGESDWPTASTILDEAAPLVPQMKGMHNIIFYRLRGALALALDNLDESVHHAQTALAHCDYIHLPQRLRSTYENSLLSAHLVNDDLGAAEQLIAAKPVGVDQNLHVDCMYDMFRGYLALCRQRRSEAIDCIRRALTVTRARNYHVLPRLPLVIAQTICSLAIEENIEVDFVLKFAAQRNMLIPRQDWEQWPWRVRIRCLGPLELATTANAPSTENLSSRKSGVLLSALLASDDHKPRIDDVAAMLWPGGGRVGRRGNFDSAVYRLRKFLGHDEALLVDDQRIYLNPSAVWVDAWALEALLESTDTLDGKDIAELRTLTSKVFSLYRGHLLVDAPNPLHFVAAKERLWGKVRRFILSVGAIYERNQQLDQAIAAYRFGAKHDPAAAEFCHALIRALVTNNRKSEALEVFTTYTRCMRALLGNVPKEELRSVMQLLADH